MKFETIAIRTQTERSKEREHSTPIFPTSSFVFDSAEQMRAVFAEEEMGNVYSRYSNPSVRELEQKLSLLEGGEQSIATASGMSAVFATFASLLSAGDHVIMSQAVFGSTIKIAENFLVKWNITYDLIPSTNIASFTQKIKKNTRICYIETPSNPTLSVIDIAELAAVCKEHRVKLIVDNCFASPYLQNPLKLGADIVIHSATKYIDGQGRVLGGSITGSQADIAQITPFMKNAGPTLSPFNAWILSKGLETLHVRMDRHCDNAEKVAAFLDGHPKISKVYYPFLESHKGVEIAKRQMKRGGGIVSFEMKEGYEMAKSLIDNTEMMSISPNLGDTRSILVHPASSTHSKVDPALRHFVGVTEGLCRLSVGLESIDDIIADLNHALQA